MNFATINDYIKISPAKPQGISEYQLVSLTAGITQRRESRCPP